MATASSRRQEVTGVLEVIQRLLILQEVDSAIHRLRKELENKPKFLAEIEFILSQKLRSIEENKNRLKDVESQKNSTEQLLFLEQEKLKKTRSRLTGQNIRNTSAYFANQREVEKVKKDADEIENSLLLILQSIDELNKNISALEAEVGKLENKRDAADAEIKSTTADLTAQLEQNLARRNDLVVGIERDVLSNYERIRTHFPENAVTTALNEMCKACFMNIPPQLYNEVLRGEKIINCPSCRRILYFHSEQEIAKEASS